MIDAELTQGIGFDAFFTLSKISALSDCLFVHVRLRILKLVHSLVNQNLELVLPAVVQIVKTLVPLNTILRDSANEILGRFSILLSDLSCALACLRFVFFTFFVLCVARCMRRENCRSRQNLVKVLELLPGPLLIGIAHCLIVDVGHVGEPVNDESAHHASLRHFVLLDVDSGQVGQGFQLGNLDEAVNVVVHEK